MADIKITQKYNTDTHLEEIECIVSKADFNKNFEKAVDAISKVAVASGFRKGHVPKNVVMRNNFQQISDRAIDFSVQQAAEQLTNIDPRPLEPLNIKTITPTEEGSLTVVFTYIPYPEVKLGKMDTIKVARQEVKKVTEEEVLKELETIWFHYQGRLDPSITKADFTSDKLNEEFFKKTDVTKDNPSLTSYETLKKFIEDYISQTYEADALMGWEKAVQEEIVKASEFTKVEGIVEKELDKRLQNYKAKFTQIGMNADEYMKSNNVNPDDLKREWRSQAERDVKLELILQKYGEEKGFEPTEADIEQNLASLDAETKKMYGNDENRIRSLIRYYFINQKSYNEILEFIKRNSGITINSDNKTAEGVALKKKSSKSSEKKNK